MKMKKITLNTQNKANDGLFQNSFPECTTDEELSKLKAENPNLDTYYIASSTIAERRFLFEDCYKNYKPFQDANFLKEITTRFHQRTWEMYLNTLFIKNGRQLKKDRGDNHADLQIMRKQSLIHVECIAVTHGDATNPDAVPKMYVAEDIEHIVASDVPEDKILLRITHALNDKHKQYKKRVVDGRVSENEPYIIAINTGELEHPEHLPRILKAVFAIGYLTLRMRKNGLPVSNPPSFWGRREIISKTNNEDINMTFFERDENKGISAVIYSNSNVLNYLTKKKNDIILVHNPLATNPISLDEFTFLTQHYVDEVSGDIVRIEAKQ